MMKNSVATTLNTAPKECPKCGRSSAEAIRVVEREIDGGSAVLICHCGHFDEIID